MPWEIVKYEDWEPTYRAIALDMHYNQEADQMACRVLNALLESPSEPVFQKVKGILLGKEVHVTGGALKNTAGVVSPLIATGRSIGLLLENDMVPDIIVTDLDKNPDSQLKACEKGAIPVIHAHGDNVTLLEEWVPKFKSPVLGTCQTRPTDNTMNFGGFTDGDRAVFLAQEAGAKKCVLHGFSMNVQEVAKYRKLRWANFLMGQMGDFTEGWI